jgi:hypothetical protein
MRTAHPQMIHVLSAFIRSSGRRGSKGRGGGEADTSNDNATTSSTFAMHHAFPVSISSSFIFISVCLCDVFSDNNTVAASSLRSVGVVAASFGFFFTTPAILSHLNVQSAAPASSVAHLPRSSPSPPSPLHWQRRVQRSSSER